MNVARLVEEVYDFAWFPRAFTLSELLEFARLNVDHEMLQNALYSDPRFIYLKSDLPDEDRFGIVKSFMQILLGALFSMVSMVINYAAILSSFDTFILERIALAA